MPNLDLPRVSLTVRILAWVIVFFIGLALFGVFRSLIVGKDVAPIGWGYAAMVVLGSLLIVPLSIYIAFTGRPPSWWKHIEKATDLEKPIDHASKRHDER